MNMKNPLNKLPIIKSIHTEVSGEVYYYNSSHTTQQEAKTKATKLEQEFPGCPVVIIPEEGQNIWTKKSHTDYNVFIGFVVFSEVTMKNPLTSELER